jgi:hypothetical protein
MTMTLTYDMQRMKERLHKRLTLGELFALAMAVGMVGVFVWQQPNSSFTYLDFKIYLGTAHGNFSYQNFYYYYGYWILPIFTVLAKLPIHLAYVLWCSINILGVFFAVRVFNGKALVAVISYQMFYSLIYGNITGLIVGGLALCWWGLVNHKWHIAGLGIAIASAKFQTGLTGSLLLLLIAEISWKDRLRVMTMPVVIWIISLFVYPGWPLELISNIVNHPPNNLASISLWRWLGPWALLVWLPPLVLPLEPKRRLIAFVAAMGLALPYFQQSDMLFLLVMPIGWIGLLGNFGYLMGLFGWVALQFLVFFPLIVYVLTLIPNIIRLFAAYSNDEKNKIIVKQEKS